LAILHDAVAFHQAGPAWSPDGRTIAVSVMLSGKSQQWDLEAVSVADGTVHEIHSSPYKIGRPLWLPSGDGLLAALDDQNNHGQLYLIPFPSGKPRRLTNDLADYDDDCIDLTRDGKTAAIVAWDESSDVWQVPAADLARAQQTESSGVALTTIAARSDGKILVTDLANQLWIMNPNGSQRTPFTDFHPAAYPLVCGQFVMFLQSTIQGDSRGLMRADADGTNIRKLVGEHVGSAACSADGKFVYYDTEDSPQKIRKISVEGGDPVDVLMIPGDQIESQFTLSLDGTRLVYLYRESGDAAEVKLALMPADGGPPVRVLRMRGEPSKLHWSPDGKTLQYTICIFCAGSASNIWEQPLEGGEPKELTNFSSGKIFDFTWSADRKLLLLLRGDLNGDVVLLSNFR
jgi:Tol biopolymer transport system component